MRYAFALFAMVAVGTASPALARKEAKLGLVLLDMRRTAAELSRLI